MSAILDGIADPPVVDVGAYTVVRCLCECPDPGVAAPAPAALGIYGLALVGVALASFAAGQLRRIRSGTRRYS